MGPVVVRIQLPTGNRCAQWQPDLGEVSGLEGGRSPRQPWRLDGVWGVWLLNPRAAVGSAGCEKWGSSRWACGRETVCLRSFAHLLTVPGGLASGAQPRGFKMASVPLPLREEEKGREGAAAQPPGLFCVGRLPLPVSELPSCESGSEWVSPRWSARRRCPLGPGRVLPVLLLPSAWPGTSSQPPPRPVTVIVAAEVWDWAVGLRGHWAPGLLCV